MTFSCSPTDPDESLVLTTTRPSSDVVVVRAVGEIDLLTAPEWRVALLDALPATTGTDARLVADLSTVSFLGASGLDVLLHVADRARDVGAELRVVVGTRRVHRVLHMMGVDRELVVESTLERAVRSGPAATTPGPRPGGHGTE